MVVWGGGHCIVHTCIMCVHVYVHVCIYVCVCVFRGGGGSGSGGIGLVWGWGGVGLVWAGGGCLCSGIWSRMAIFQVRANVSSVVILF